MRREKKERKTMSYIEIIEEMVREIFVVENSKEVREYYFYLLKKVYAGKKSTSIPFKIAKEDEQKFIEQYLDADALYEGAAENGSMKRECQSDGQVKISLLYKGKWFLLAAGQI